MNRAIRRVGYAVVVLLLVLIAQLTYLQVLDSSKLADDPRNSRSFLRDFTQPRGSIVSADGRILARSVASDDEYGRQRIYPFGELFSQTVGYQSVVVGSTGVERSYNSALTGSGRTVGLRDIGDLLVGKDRTANVILSLRTDVQLVAKQALGAQHGSVVALDPRTGAILAMYSNPSYDPQPLAGHDPKKVQDYFALLNADPAKPSLPRAYREIYPPGSTFKIVTSEAALDTGTATPTSTFPVLRSFRPPQAGQAIANFGNESCGGTLLESFVHSCNTTFARLGLELGEQFPPKMAGFGIYSAPPIDLSPGAATSTGPTPGTFRTDMPSFALSGIGQNGVAATPLQMALVAASVANGGVIMAPHVAARIEDQDGKVLRTVQAHPWETAMPPATAATLTGFMTQVVQRGTGTSAQIPGVTVAGKTGTAETCDTCRPHAWFVAFAPAEAPQYAVAVIVENGGNRQSETTGGKVAAPIAKQVLQFLLGK